MDTTWLAVISIILLIAVLALILLGSMPRKTVAPSTGSFCPDGSCRCNRCGGPQGHCGCPMRNMCNRCGSSMPCGCLLGSN